MASSRRVSAPSLAALWILLACTLGVGGSQGWTTLSGSEATTTIDAPSAARSVVRGGTDAARGVSLGLSVESRSTLREVTPPSARTTTS